MFVELLDALIEQGKDELVLCQEDSINALQGKIRAYIFLRKLITTQATIDRK